MNKFNCLVNEVLSDQKTLIKQIDSLLHDWVISSLSDTEKRQKIGKELEQLNIPEEYKQIPSKTLFRVVNKLNPLNPPLYSSYAYDIRGLNKMIQWLKKIFKIQENGLEIKEMNPLETNVIVCIPTFYKKTKIFGGKQYEKLWKSEYEVIVKNV